MRELQGFWAEDIRDFWAFVATGPGLKRIENLTETEREDVILRIRDIGGVEGRFVGSELRISVGISDFNVALVRDLVAHAPVLEGWSFRAFEPATGFADLHFDGRVWPWKDIRATFDTPSEHDLHLYLNDPPSYSAEWQSAVDRWLKSGMGERWMLEQTTRVKISNAVRVPSDAQSLSELAKSVSEPPITFFACDGDEELPGELPALWRERFDIIWNPEDIVCWEASTTTTFEEALAAYIRRYWRVMCNGPYRGMHSLSFVEGKRAELLLRMIYMHEEKWDNPNGRQSITVQASEPGLAKRFAKELMAFVLPDGLLATNIEGMDFKDVPLYDTGSIGHCSEERISAVFFVTSRVVGVVRLQFDAQGES